MDGVSPARDRFALSRLSIRLVDFARELGTTRGDVEDDLRHALRSARAAGHDIEIVPARCKSCDFVFGEDKLLKPGRCPACKGSRLFEPMIRIRRSAPRGRDDPDP